VREQVPGGTARARMPENQRASVPASQNASEPAKERARGAGGPAAISYIYLGR